jgi:hypothetical protein
MKMFPDENDALRRPLEDIRDTLLQCSSIEEARKLLLEREAALSG